MAACRWLGQAASTLWRRFAECYRRLRFVGVGLVEVGQRFREIGAEAAVRLLDQTLAEEMKTDNTLSKIAETAVNAKAA